MSELDSFISGPSNEQVVRLYSDSAEKSQTSETLLGDIWSGVESAGNVIKENPVASTLAAGATVTAVILSRGRLLSAMGKGAGDVLKAEEFASQAVGKVKPWESRAAIRGGVSYIDSGIGVRAGEFDLFRKPVLDSSLSSGARLNPRLAEDLATMAKENPFVSPESLRAAREAELKLGTHSDFVPRKPAPVLQLYDQSGYPPISIRGGMQRFDQSRFNSIPVRANMRDR